MKKERLKVLTLNIHKGLSHFNRRMVIHDLREGLQSLDPDLVFLQEVQGLNQRFALRFTACINALGSTSYNAARSVLSMTRWLGRIRMRRASCSIGII